MQHVMELHVENLLLKILSDTINFYCKIFYQKSKLPLFSRCLKEPLEVGKTPTHI